MKTVCIATALAVLAGGTLLAPVAAQTPASAPVSTRASAEPPLPALRLLPKQSEEEIDLFLERSNLWFSEGKRLLEEGKLEEGIVKLNASLDAFPNSEAYRLLVDAYLQKGWKRTAAHYYKEWLCDYEGKRWRITGEADTEHLMRYALLLQELGNWSEAVEIYNRGIVCLNPSNSNFAPVRVGAVFIATRVDRQRFRVEANLALGVAYLLKGATIMELRDKSIEHLKLAYQLQPNNPFVLFYLGHIYLMKNDNPKAVYWLNKAASSGNTAVQEGVNFTFDFYDLYGVKPVENTP